ncbi:hypothetical protein AB0J35_60125 [Nonomuraea angiospora]
MTDVSPKTLPSSSGIPYAMTKTMTATRGRGYRAPSWLDAVPTSGRWWSRCQPSPYLTPACPTATPRRTCCTALASATLPRFAPSACRCGSVRETRRSRADLG